jgi:uncharacterized protein (TIGR02001 family)
MNKKHVKHAICLSAVIASSFANISIANAGGEISYNAGIVSQYLWRGFNINNEKIAVQGGVDFEHENGIYAGIWASQYDFGDDDDGIETDLYGGYAFSLNDSFWLDFSVTRYQYSGDSDASLEWKAGIGHEFFTLNYHRDQDLDTKYLELNSSFPLNDTWTINGHAGNNNDGQENYYDYSVFVNFALSENIEWSGGYSDHEFDEKGSEGTFFFSLNASF